MKKTLFIGIDAACWEYLNPLLEAGRLPTVQKLMEKGSWGVLDSTLPAQTPTAWSSIITGKNPGKHGIFDFLLRLPNGQSFITANANHRLGTTFWKLLNDQGIRVGLVDIPFTYPIDPLDGFLVCGFGTPDTTKDIVYPEHEIKWIMDNFEGFSPFVDPLLLRKGSPEEIFEAERRQQSYFVEIAIQLSKRHHIQVLAINLLFPDHANHKMPSMEQVEKAICLSDADLGRIIREFEPDNIMLFSDHGSRRVKGDFLLHAWLRDRGYCLQISRAPKERIDALNWALKRWTQKRGWSGSSEKILRNIANRLLLWLPGNGSSVQWRFLDQQVPYAYEHVFLDEEIDMYKSQVLLGSSYSGLLHFNDNGFKKQVNLSSMDKMERLTEISEELSEITDPETGRHLLAGVFRSEALYNGPANQLAPDLILDIYDSPWNILSTFRRGYLGESIRNKYFAENYSDFGHHSKLGVFVFSGQDFKSESDEFHGHVMDLPATLLYLYDVPIPSDFDGTVLTSVINSEFLEQHAIKNQPGDKDDIYIINEILSKEEEIKLSEHLQALGYLD
jgi:predicted AlkP superfamily phosphohydrolase/phosphomutase